MGTADGRSIGVVGQGEPDPLVEGYAAEVGYGLAAAGVTLLCGGLGGVMAAACRGAKKAGGLTVGLLPGLDRAEANPHVDVAIPTGMGEARNVLLVRAAAALVAIGGGYGTLSEVALALRAGVPVIGLHTWQLHRDGAWDDGIVVVSTAAEAIAAALEATKGRA